MKKSSRKILSTVLALSMVFSVFAAPLSYGESESGKKDVKVEESTDSKEDETKENEGEAVPPVEETTEVKLNFVVNIDNSQGVGENKDLKLQLKLADEELEKIDKKDKKDLEFKDWKDIDFNKEISLRKDHKYQYKFNKLNFNLKNLYYGENKIEIGDNEFVADREGSLKFDFESVKVEEKSKLNIKLTAPSKLNKVKLNVNGKEESFGKDIELKAGEYIVEFTEVPSDYEIILPYDLKALATDEGVNKFKVVVVKDMDIRFVARKKDKADEKQVILNPFSPKSKYISGKTYKDGKVYLEIGNEKLVGNADKNGEFSIKVNLDKDKEKIIANYYVYDTIGNAFSPKYQQVSIKEVLPLKLGEIKSGTSEFSGVSSEEVDIFAKVGDKSYKVKSDRDGEFTIETEKPLEIGTEIEVQAIKDSDHKSNILYRVVDKKDPEFTRLKDKDRYLTSLRIAEETYEKPNNIIIASGENTADALAAGPIANALNAPILLTHKTAVNREILDYIKKSEAKNIYIIGGEGSISEDIREILQFDGTKVQRIAGSNRYDTSLEIADSLKEHFNYNGGFILANGYKAADAMSISTYATAKKMPILLVGDSFMPENIKVKLKDWNIKKLEIVGGSSSVANSVVTDNDFALEKRISGRNRYETSLEVAKNLPGEVDSFLIANGTERACVDALAAGPLAYVKHGAILLTDGDNLIKDIQDYIEASHIYDFYITGGSSSVDENIVEEIKDLLN